MNPLDKQLYEIFADKTLSFGCVVTPNGGDNEGITFTYIRHGFFGDCEILDKEQVEHSYQEEYIEIFGHTPELFPDVARELRKDGYVLELLKLDTIKSVLKISRWDIKKDTIIPYSSTLPLIKQEDSTKQSLINLFKQGTKN